ncbi:MAG: C4-dicarboxylate TRAP transporter substrate-binding protein [SAR324 cluster bacterium]|nr:C4-dicarboxylate TRAP transporter substrate-binding protein [SAR324 cluster bacterium]
MMRNKSLVKFLITVSFFIFSSYSLVFATETIKLTAIDGYPEKSAWVREFIDFYIPTIDKKLAKTGNYKIKWNKAFGGKIVKPKKVLQGLQTRAGDIGVVTTVFHEDKVPLQAIAYRTPFVTSDSALLAKTIDDLKDKFPQYDQAWKKYKQVYLTNLVVIDSYQIFLKKPVKSLADLKGLKIAGAGINLRYIKKLGAGAVGGSLVGYYDRLQKGVVDGAIIWPEAAMTFKINEVAPYMLNVDIGAVNSKAVTVNEKSWAKLPKEVQDVLAESAIEYRDHMAQVALDLGKKKLAEFKAKGGTVIEISESEKAAWVKDIDPIAKEWADKLETQKIPGHEILTTYMTTMRENGQPILRNWQND